MEQNVFFRWISRLNSMLFLLLLILLIGFALYQISESNRWRQGTAVEVLGGETAEKLDEEFRLSDITKVCGKNIQYVELMSFPKSSGFSSGGYDSVIRNVVFFVGDELESHWLYDTDNYLINEIDQLKRSADDCKDRETMAILYAVVKSDTNNNGELDSNDEITVALTSADGLNYVEIDTGLSAVIDHSVNSDATELTVLSQKGGSVVMKRYSLSDYRQTSQREISRIGKKS